MRVAGLKPLFINAFVFYLLSTAVWAQSNTNRLYQLIDAGKQEIYNFQLDSALTIFREIQHEFPEYPHGYFYEAYITAIYFSQDRANPALDSLLNETVKRAAEKGEEYKKRTDNSADALYYLGASYGVLGIYHVLNRNYLKGYIYGKRGKDYLEKVVETDSTYYDAYVGLGVFHYYVDLLPGIVKFFAKILGFQGDREKGIREMLLTANRGRFFKVEARFVYATFRYFLEGDERNSLQTFFKLHRDYPDNPALTLLLGYHYRRNGNILEALRYFSAVPEKYSLTLPQISIMKFYNLGVCYFRLNNFPESEKYFNLLMDTSLRKSRYYVAALALYKGLLSDMKGEHNAADRYYNMIVDNRETQYWFNTSRIYVKYDFDSLMRHYVIAENDIFTLNIPAAEKEIGNLQNILETNPRAAHNPYLIYLVQDLQGILYLQKGEVRESLEIYENLMPNINKINDDFQRAWVYIHYARVLRETEEFQKANEALEKASSCDDEYTKIILEREKYIVNHRKKQSKT